MLEQEAGNETTEIKRLRIQREVDVDEKSEMARKLNAAVDAFSGTYIYIHKHAHTHTRTCTHANTHTHTPTHTHTYTHALTHNPLSLSLSVFIFRTHTLMHTQ